MGEFSGSLGQSISFFVCRHQRHGCVPDDPDSHGCQLKSDNLHIKNTSFLPFSMHLLEFLVSSLMSADYEHYLKHGPIPMIDVWNLEFVFFNIEYLKGYFK